jgi:hypothetical protein
MDPADECDRESGPRKIVTLLSLALDAVPHAPKDARNEALGLALGFPVGLLSVGAPPVLAQEIIAVCSAL